MMLHSTKWLWAAIATGCLAGAASAQSDNFDSYALGSVINGQGGWKQWDSAPNTTSIIVDNTTGFARSGNAVAVDSTAAGTSDLVHEYPGIEVGQQTYKGYCYVDPTLTGKIYFLLLNKYQDFGPYDWSVQLTLDGATQTWVVDAGSASTAQGNLVVSQWVECKAQIDLTADTCEVFYNGVSTAPAYQWTGGVFGGGLGALDIACVDLYHNNAPGSGRGYWDDVSLSSGFPPPIPLVYCVAKSNSVGCTPSIGFVSGDVASATNQGPFRVNATNMVNNKSCLLFYGVAGQAATPFQGGTLCVKSPIKRTPGTVTGGNPPPNDCSGAPVINMNAFAAGLGGGSPLPALTVPGTVVDCQWWGRDPGFVAPNNTQLSDGLEYTVGV